MAKELSFYDLLDLFFFPQIRLREGLYSVFLEQWLKVFPRDQFLVMRLEDVSANRMKYIMKAWSFLGTG